MTLPRRFVSAAAAIVLAPALGGCALWRPVTVPIPTIRVPAPCPERPDTLLVMLPGSYSLPQEFATEGFIDAVRRRGIAADLLLVDAHVGYYSDRSIVARLRDDVVEPALGDGYRHIWLVGISIGAFGALIYAEVQPRGIDGIVALGPYLGKRALVEEIRAQGGLARWRAPTGMLDPGDIDTIVWRWLQPYALAPTPAARPLLFLGYGLDDRFGVSDDTLAAALPAERVFTTVGGHDWAPWRTLWNRVLDAVPLPRKSACVALR